MLIVGCCPLRPLIVFRLSRNGRTGSSREYDVKPFLKDCGPYFARLNDPDYFKKVRVSEFGDTVEWPEGQDIAPESLYEDSLVLGVAD